MPLSGETNFNIEKKAERSVYEALTDWNNLVRNHSRGYPMFISSRKIKSSETWWDKIISFFKKKISKKNRFPLPKQVSARLMADDFVSVQPLALPTGILFYMDYMDEVEREDVFKRIVLFEKYKPRYIRHYLEVPHLT